MGRRKIEIKPITEERNRSVTFIKRKGGLFKKAHELAVLCQVELALVVITPDRKVHEYCTASNIEDLVRSCQKYPVVERKGLQDYSARYMGASGHDGDDDGQEEANMEDSDAEPEEVHMKKKAEHQEVKMRHIMDKEHAERPTSISDSRPGSRPRLKVQIPQIPPVVTPEPQDALKRERDAVAGAALGRSQQVADAERASQQVPHAHAHAQQRQQLQMQQNGGRVNSSGELSEASAAHLIEADKAAHAQAQAGEPQHPQVTFQPRLNTNRGLPQSPGGFVAQGYPPYVPYAGYFNNYPVGYGYPAPPSALPGGSAKPSAGAASSSSSSRPAPPGPNAGSGPGSNSSNMIANAQASQGPSMAAGGQRPSGAPGTSATATSAGGGRWSAYPQSPMTYFLPAPMSGADTSQSKLEPGAISAAMPSRYMNEMLASPSNYFSMEWGVWDPQASAGPGGTARVSPSSLPTQAPNGSNHGEAPISSPLQFVSVPGNERKRTVADENASSKWRSKE